MPSRKVEAGAAALLIAMLAAATALAALPAALTISVLSTRPDMVTATDPSAPAGAPDSGEALIQIAAPAGSQVSLAVLTVTLNGTTGCRGGTEVTKEFHRGAAPGTFLGLVRGLGIGKDTLSACADTHPVMEGRLTLEVHSSAGPVFSGPWQKPFFCEIETPVANPNTGGPIVNPFTRAALSGFVDPVTGKPPVGIDRATGRTAALAPIANPNPACAANTIVTYYYMSSHYGRGMRVLADPHDRTQWPPDIAMTRTNRGRRVPFIVRVETGTIDRGIYQIAILHDPTSDPPPDPFHRPAGWNGRLIYTFGGNCVGGNHQGTSTGGVLNEQWSDTIRGPAAPPFTDNPFLAQGYAVASATLDVLGNDCNDVIAAETMMMVKERFIDEYGPPAHTIGWGLSGGTMLQQLIAQDYPGLLNGLILGLSFPDLVTMIEPITDCSLLNSAFDIISSNYKSSPARNPLPLTSAQMAAVSGFHSWETCKRWMGDYPYGLQTDYNNPNNMNVGYSPGVLLPGACDLSIPPEFAWPNPGGIRCDAFSNMANMFGAADGAARKPLDNVGVQYGLAAYNAGLIRWPHFIALNEYVGGYDKDGGIVAGTVSNSRQVVPNRTAANDLALRIAYRSGRVNMGNLATIPIIALEPYGDAVDEIHSRYGPFMSRARLIAAYGQAGHSGIGVLDRNGNPINQVILTGPMPPGGNSMNGGFFFGEFFDYGGKFTGFNAVALMDQWLDNISADRPHRPEYVKVAASRPGSLADGCFYQGAGGKWHEHLEPAFYNGMARYDRGPRRECTSCSRQCPSRCKCNQLYPSYANPRLAAGGGGSGAAPPLAGDILKCALKPIDSRDYRGGLTRAQRRELNTVFPDGVCDWTKAGLHRQPPWNTWLAFPEPREGVSRNSK
ncbi:MAG: DUF6351 family protein [Candidatus Binataceae bacterium]